jgi:hypothetical protein
MIYGGPECREGRPEQVSDFVRLLWVKQNYSDLSKLRREKG